jgi:hypothetical protein
LVVQSSRNRWNAKPATVGADPDIKRQIDENLRLIYQQCLEEEMPAKMQTLLDRLDDEDEPR